MTKLYATLLLSLTALPLFSQSVVTMPVRQNPVFEVSTDKVDVTVPDTADEILLGGDLVIKGGSGEYRFNWTDGKGSYLADTPELAVTSPGTYLLTISDTCECSHTVEFSVATAGVDEITDGFEPVRITVVDMSGRMVALFTAPEGFTLADPDLSNLPSGIYILTLTDASGRNVTSRIIR
jgi:hypothetical protein